VLSVERIGFGDLSSDSRLSMNRMAEQTGFFSERGQRRQLLMCSPPQSPVVQKKLPKIGNEIVRKKRKKAKKKKNHPFINRARVISSFDRNGNVMEVHNVSSPFWD